MRHKARKVPVMRELGGKGRQRAPSEPAGPGIGYSPRPSPGGSAPPPPSLYLLTCKEGAGEEERWRARAEKEINCYFSSLTK